LILRARALEHPAQRTVVIANNDVVADGAERPAEQLRVKFPRRRDVVGDEIRPDKFSWKTRAARHAAQWRQLRWCLVRAATTASDSTAISQRTATRRIFLRMASALPLSA